MRNFVCAFIELDSLGKDDGAHQPSMMALHRPQTSWHSGSVSDSAAARRLEALNIVKNARMYTIWMVARRTCFSQESFLHMSKIVEGVEIRACIISGVMGLFLGVGLTISLAMPTSVHSSR